jgi:hypothetical protein
MTILVVLFEMIVANYKKYNNENIFLKPNKQIKSHRTATLIRIIHSGIHAPPTKYICIPKRKYHYNRKSIVPTAENSSITLH